MLVIFTCFINVLFFNVHVLPFGVINNDDHDTLQWAALPPSKLPLPIP